MIILKFKVMPLVASLPLLVIYWMATTSLTWATNVDAKQDNTAINSTRANNSTAEAMIFTFLDETLHTSTESAKLRLKRQSGGKYTDASKMSQMKVLRLILQMIRNAWASSYVGGAHPLHHEVPKPVVQLYKESILSMFFPKNDQENGEA